jgi:hypothetical protein
VLGAVESSNDGLQDGFGVSCTCSCRGLWGWGGGKGDELEELMQLEMYSSGVYSNMSSLVKVVSTIGWSEGCVCITVELEYRE